MGLEASKRGLFTQQSALYTTGHNISNANTLGYSRQRVNFETTQGYPGTGLNAPKTPGHIGTGVQASSVQRIRDEFIDRQYRQETNKLGYWEAKSQSISQMEDIMSEPSEFGINQAFNDFWKSLQDISTNPSDVAARKVALAKAQSLAQSFNYNDTQLKTIQGNIGNEIDVSTDQINSILKQIAEINKQIQAVEPNGYMPNDLYDARDMLVDQLNEYMPVSVSFEKSGGNALDIAEGSMTVKFKPFGGTDADAITLVQGKDYATLKTLDTTGTKVDGNIDNPNTSQVYNAFGKISVTGMGNIPNGEMEYGDFEASKGKLLSLINSYGYTQTDVNGNTVTKGHYPEMIANLDKLVNAFVQSFNAVHNAGYSSNSDSTLTSGDGGDFFDATGLTAGTIKVAITDPSKIAASSGTGEEGNGKWAIELANLQFLGIKDGAGVSIGNITATLPNGLNLEGATFQSFYEGLIGQLGVDGKEAVRLEYNSATILLTVENNRSSMSSVSLDEEMTNMITFQQAYNANARMITVVDEILDKIINGMGRAGL